MTRFLVRRLLLAIPSLLGLMVLCFVLLRVVPSDPAAALAGDNATPEQIAELRTKFGFDRPLYEQFYLYARQVLSGDLGNSVQTNRPVVQDILERLPATLELTLFSLLVSALVAIPLGTIAAVAHNSPVDHLVRLLTVGGLAIASFWFAIMLQFWLAMDLDLLPLRGRIATGLGMPPFVTGSFLVDSIIAGRWDQLASTLRHLVLPTIVLCIPGLATIARFTRSGVLDTMQKDFVTYETAAGYSRGRLIGIYVLRNSVVAAVTQIGLLFGGLISGAVAVETIFDWPGIGSYAVSAILTQDYKAVLAVTLFVGMVYALVNIAVDLLHATLDPRIAEQM